MSFIYALKAAAAAFQATAHILDLVFEMGQALAEGIFGFDLLLRGQGAIVLHVFADEAQLLHNALPLLVARCWLLVCHSFTCRACPW